MQVAWAGWHPSYLHFLISYLSAYTHLGCWKDTGKRAVPQIDGSDARIRGNYRARADAINKCYQVARERHMVLFAVQHQGWCAAAKNFAGYQKYGKSNACKNGKGGPWANDVYRITNPLKPAAPKREYIGILVPRSFPPSLEPPPLFTHRFALPLLSLIV